MQLEYAKKGATGGALMALQAGADLNHKDWTPLHKTAYYNKPEVAKVLLANGAQVNVRDKYGRTALDRAMGFGRVCACCGASSEIRALLRQHGAKRGGQLEGMGPHGEVAEVAEEPGREEGFNDSHSTMLKRTSS